MFEILLWKKFRPYIQCETETKDGKNKLKGKRGFAIGGGGYSSFFKNTSIEPACVVNEV